MHVHGMQQRAATETSHHTRPPEALVFHAFLGLGLIVTYYTEPTIPKTFRFYLVTDSKYTYS